MREGKKKRGTQSVRSCAWERKNNMMLTSRCGSLVMTWTIWNYRGINSAWRLALWVRGLVSIGLWLCLYYYQLHTVVVRVAPCILFCHKPLCNLLNQHGGVTEMKESCFIFPWFSEHGLRQLKWKYYSCRGSDSAWWSKRVCLVSSGLFQTPVCWTCCDGCGWTSLSCLASSVCRWCFLWAFLCRFLVSLSVTTRFLVIRTSQCFNMNIESSCFVPLDDVTLILDTEQNKDLEAARHSPCEGRLWQVWTTGE